MGIRARHKHAILELLEPLDVRWTLDETNVPGPCNGRGLDRRRMRADSRREGACERRIAIGHADGCFRWSRWRHGEGCWSTIHAFTRQLWQRTAVRQDLE